MAELARIDDTFVEKETRHRRWQRGLLATSFLIGAVFVASYFAPKTLEKDTQAIPAAPRIAQAYDKAPTRIALDTVRSLTQNAVTEAPTPAVVAAIPEITPDGMDAPTEAPTIPQMSNAQQAQQAFGGYNPAAEWPASTPEQLATELANVNARLAQDVKPEIGMVDSGAVLMAEPVGTPQTAEQSVADHMLDFGRAAVDKTTGATSFLWNKTSEFTVDTWNSIFGGSEKTTPAAQESLEQSAPAPMATPTGPAADAVVAVADQAPAPAADNANVFEQSYQWVTVDGVNMTKEAYTAVFGPVIAPETFGEQTRDMTNKVTDPVIDAGTEVREGLAKKMGASMGKPGEYAGQAIGAVPDAALTVVGAGGKIIGHSFGWASHGVEKGWKWAFGNDPKTPDVQVAAIPTPPQSTVTVSAPAPEEDSTFQQVGSEYLGKVGKTVGQGVDKGVKETKEVYNTVAKSVEKPETTGDEIRNFTNKATDPLIDTGTEVREGLAKKMGASMGKPGEYAGQAIGAVPDAALTVVGAGGKVIGHTVGWAAHGIEKGWKWAFNTHDDTNITVTAEQPAKTAGLTDAIRQAQQPAATAPAQTPTIDPTFNGVRFGEARVTKMLQEHLAQLKQEYNALYPNAPVSAQTTPPATKEAQKDALIQKLMVQAQASQMQNEALAAKLDSRDPSKLTVRQNGR